MSFADGRSSAERWLSENENSNLVLSEADDNNKRLVFQVPGTSISFYIDCSEDLHLWTDNEELLSVLEADIEWMTSRREKTIGEILGRAYTSLKPLIETSSVNSEGEEELFFEADEGKNSDDDDNDEEEKTKESDSDDGEDSNYFNAQGSQTAVKRLLKELKEMRKSKGKYGITGNPRGDNLFIWDVELSFPDDTKLQNDLEEFAEASGQLPVISLEMKCPDDFPYSPPFIRVIHPRFQFLSEFSAVTEGGSIFIEELRKSGWSPANCIENILVHVRSEILSDRDASLDMSSSKSDYTEEEARDAFRRMEEFLWWDK